MEAFALAGVLFVVAGIRYQLRLWARYRRMQRHHLSMPPAGRASPPANAATPFAEHQSVAPFPGDIQ